MSADCLRPDARNKFVCVDDSCIRLRSATMNTMSLKAGAVSLSSRRNVASAVQPRAAALRPRAAGGRASRLVVRAEKVVGIDLGTTNSAVRKPPAVRPVEHLTGCLKHVTTGAGGCDGGWQAYHRDERGGWSHHAVRRRLHQGRGAPCWPGTLGDPGRSNACEAGKLHQTMWMSQWRPALRQAVVCCNSLRAQNRHVCFSKKSPGGDSSHVWASIPRPCCT